MKYLKFVWQAYTWLVLICAFALVLDIIGFDDTETQSAIWFIPTFGICLYWIGITLLIRFKIAKRPIHLAVTWAIILPMWVVAFTALAFVTDGFEATGGTPSGATVFLAAIWGFKTLRVKE